MAQYLSYIAENDEGAALRIKTELDKAIRALDHMPKRYPILNDPYIMPNKYHKMLVAKNFVVLYQVRDKHVYVDWVVDCRQDYRWLIQ